MLAYYDFTAAAAGGQALIHAAGRYFRYYAGSAGGADVRIVLRVAGGLSAILKPGQAITLPDGVTADQWSIENYIKGADIVGVAMVGAGKLDDSTITGDVNVIDGGLSRTRANAAFIGVGSIGNVAAQYAHVQLFNPAASGKNVFLERFIASGSAAQAFTIGLYNTQLGTAAAALSKKFGGAAGVGLVRTTSNVAQLITSTAMVGRIAAGAGFDVGFREPIMLAPGGGFVVVSNTVNLDMVTNFEWYEETV